MNKNYYITTAIAYTSGKPHIGNTYEIILSDAIARFKRFQGFNVRFQTGTDEHGQKIEDKAKEINKNPQEFVDIIANDIKSNFDLMNISYDKFIRTTDEYHVKQIQKIFKKLYDQGDIYKGSYEGLYCTPCESFWTESQLVDGKCPDCGREVVKTNEEAYFLNLQKYTDRLVKHIEENPGFIQPESRKNEMLNNFIKPGLHDLCVSRTSFKWGIPVDFDPDHVVYVWVDALSNYITGLGYDVDGKHAPEFNEFWPCDAHIIGKDILRFHTIYWPIMLMALDLPLPKQVFGHPWLLQGEGKMSKSKGNVMYAEDLVKLFGVDAVRYYCLHEMPFAQDGTITYELMIERINSDLANVLGNLVNRTISMINKYFGGTISNKNINTELENDLFDVFNSALNKVEDQMSEFKVAGAIDEIFNVLRRCNKYIDETLPWALAKDESQKDRLETVMYNLVDGIRIATGLLNSFLPNTANKIIEQIGVDTIQFETMKQGCMSDSITVIAKPEILFNRIDVEEKMSEINADKKEEIIDNLIGIEDFDKVELKVGKIISVERHPKADKLLVSCVDLGDEKRTIVSGIAEFYKPEDLVGNNVIVVTNLKPVKLRGVESQGMILAAKNNSNLSVITTLNDIEIGTQVK